MKQIIPFKKELLFKTAVSEITSISLEHTLTLKNDDLISGEFLITGDYKMTEGSINREKFEFRLPFDIALDSRYDMSSIVIDIDNFYYEIVNNESLQVNIDVYVEGVKLEDSSLEEEPILEESLLEERSSEVLSSKPEEEGGEEEKSTLEEPVLEEPVLEEKVSEETVKNRMDDLEPAIEKPVIPQVMIEHSKMEAETDNFNLFENIDNSDTYVTYYVYIVKESDTLEKILMKYNVTQDDILLYNSNLDIKPGMKLIIPSISHE